MAGMGGSIESVSIKSREFFVTADAEAQRKLGGFENEEEANGNGTSRTIKTRVNWMLGGIVVEIDDARGDQEFLQGIADGSEYVAMVITLVSGLSYQGTGQLTGELQASTQNATMPITLSGTGKLTKQ